MMAIAMNELRNKYEAFALADSMADAPRQEVYLQIEDGYTYTKYFFNLLKKKVPIYKTVKSTILDIVNYEYVLELNTHTCEKKVRWIPK